MTAVRTVGRLASKVMLALLFGFAIWVGVGALFPEHASSAQAPTEVTSYTVQPGQTLWTYAEMVTPEGGDVSATVDELMELNDLDSASVQAGQRIVVPVQSAQ
ncbi:LysM peptidoglycan-binding domain-containing protein [Bifidobacterium sp. CP2]|uniref:LysM peptidoglycan-binding domain-containing protein n=1 Tax=Bifidobacterium sp. CP2 TaxID=2809025 RepID=UPI003204935C